MTESGLAERFEAHRPRLRAVAYRMLGSHSEADDAVQEAWLRLHRSDADAVTNLGGWLTTVVSRIALDALRSRTARREEPLDRLPDPVVHTTTAGPAADPAEAALLADSVSLAVLVVLQSLSPAERLVFVLHDLFAVPFEEVARIVDRSPAAAKQLASRARRRVRGRTPEPDADLAGQQRVVAAFLAAAHGGDLDGLLAVLDPDVTLRVDQGRGVRVLQGAATVAGRALAFARPGAVPTPVVVNGAAGVLTRAAGRPVSLMAMTVHAGRIVAIDLLADPDRLAGLLPPPSSSHGTG